MRLTGSDSEFRAPASRLGGGTVGYWHHDRIREAAASAAVLVLVPVEPLPNVADNNNSMTVRRIHNEPKVSGVKNTHS